MSQDLSSKFIRAVVAGRTDVGRKRKHNEDTFLVNPDLGLLVVADGMGGHNAGEVASALVIHTVEDFFLTGGAGATLDDLPGEDVPLTPDARTLVSATRKANRDVHEAAAANRKRSGMGSTMVTLYVSDTDRMVHISHAGDSRCYRIREGQIEQLTRDHSLVSDALAMHPDLPPEVLAELPKNVITRAVGATAAMPVEIRSEPVNEQDLFLLCSDGLSGPVAPEQMLEISTLTTDLDELCEMLIAMANDAGGPDNITVVLLRVDAVLMR